MSGETIYEAPRKYNVSQMRVHDYLYDSTFIVSGARDYARTAFKAAMASAQVVIQPVYRTMFSELRKFPRMQVVYHPNCRLPGHVDRSYGGYVERSLRGKSEPPQPDGKDRFKYTAIPKKVLNLKSATLDFHPPSPHFVGTCKPRNRGTQSLFRESSAQTVPWGPDTTAAEGTVPEVKYLDALEWGPGCPYRNGDLPADFHTTEIINKMRHARKWSEIVEKGQFPRYMKKQNAIISDIETKDWIFREAEIDELQDIRLHLLHKLKAEQQRKNTNRTSKKLEKLWANKKESMEHKIEHIRRTRDRELRKLSSFYGRGGQKKVDLHAPLAREGYRASRRHAEIVYDPSLLALEDHNKISEPPAWLEQCAQNLTKSCSGNHLPRNITQLCERETKWSEQFLENLHNDLKKARLGAASVSAGLLRVLRPRYLPVSPRPPTPDVEGAAEEDETAYQAALVMQRIIRGRAVQILMFEGRTRAAELTEELKTTHGLQREDRDRIAKEEARARDYQAMRSEAEQKEQAISSLVQELCGGAVAAALDFLEKELRRLREERRQHAFILIALREKAMREAAEAGRRQKEEHRRREHDEMFKRVLGVTQETVDAYLQEVIEDGVSLAAEQDAVKEAISKAERFEKKMAECGSVSTAEQNEIVAELVQQFLLPEAHKTAARDRLEALQRGRMEAARGSLLGGLRKGEIMKKTCNRCGGPLDDRCQCRACSPTTLVASTVARDDVRWKYARRREEIEKTLEERYPPRHEVRCMINAIVDDGEKLLYKFKCDNGELIELYQRCDGTVECSDSTDESLATCASVVCPSHLFQCAYGACVNSGADCNNLQECADGSDESDLLCNRTSVTTTTSITTKESSTACVLPNHPKNGIYRMTDGVKYIKYIPGSVQESLVVLNATCNSEYKLVGKDLLFCHEGIWSSDFPICARTCKLERSHSVEYRCITGDERYVGTRQCEEYEVEGTMIQPECKKPYYYSSTDLYYMQCHNGEWNYEPRCEAECGTLTPQAQPLVLGGRVAARGEVPWHAGIYSKRYSPPTQICGASLIREAVLVSAAHCFWFSQRTEPVKDYAVAVGKLYREWRHPSDLDYEQTSDVKSIHIPRYYRGFAMNYQHDIAIIVVSQPFSYRPYIRPLCINFPENLNELLLKNGDIGKVAGWGLTTVFSGSESPKLKVLDMPYIDFDECLNKTPDYFQDYLSGDKICGGFTNGTSLCKGDSGGGFAFPIVINGRTRYFLRGIVSTSPPLPDGSSCNVYTIASFTDVFENKIFMKMHLN